jgi:predicted transposase YbfD/YdcC
MDIPQYNSVLDLLSALPDPRKPRGKQIEWTFIWMIIFAGMLHNQRGATAIAHWARCHRETLVATFRPAKNRLPSESTIRRAIQQVDAALLDGLLARLQSPPPAPDPAASLVAYAIDGKHVRGAGAHGNSTILVSLVEHTSARVLAQTPVSKKRHESQAVPGLLDTRDLRGCIVTMDAGLTHPKIARQIREQGGHFFMVVKRNQRQLYDELRWYFARPPLLCERPWQTTRTVGKEHGRLETRTLTCTDDLDEYLEWTEVRQVLRRECERIEVKTGKVTRTVSYAITSVPSADTSPAQVEAMWRGHWTIENRQHYVRDVTMGEDGCQMHKGAAPQALAAVRCGLIRLLRLAGWKNIAAGIREFSASLPKTLRLLGVSEVRL